jgi:7-cyano-7-deazaguanine reductase
VFLLPDVETCHHPLGILRRRVREFPVAEHPGNQNCGGRSARQTKTKEFFVNNESLPESVTQPPDLEGLTVLGRPAKPSRNLEAFPNRTPGRYYLVTLEADEFTCLCPITSQPDFARIRVQYVPDDKIVESKSFKLYLWSFRDEGAFHEHVINRILDDLVKVLDPHWCKVTGIFNIRGGIGITVQAEYTKTLEARRQWAPGDNHP